MFYVCGVVWCVCYRIVFYMAIYFIDVVVCARMVLLLHFVFVFMHFKKKEEKATIFRITFFLLCNLKSKFKIKKCVFVV